MGNLEKIFIKRGKLAPMDEVHHTKMQAGKGILGNIEQNGLRQITLMEKEKWEELMQYHKVELPFQTRRANLVISGINLKDTRRKILVIGECKIEVFGELKPCERMDKAVMGLQKSMYNNWKGGAFGKALIDGYIQVGNKIYWK